MEHDACSCLEQLVTAVVTYQRCTAVTGSWPQIEDSYEVFNFCCQTDFMVEGGREPSTHGAVVFAQYTQYT